MNFSTSPGSTEVPEKFRARQSKQKKKCENSNGGITLNQNTHSEGEEMTETGCWEKNVGSPIETHFHFRWLSLSALKGKGPRCYQRSLGSTMLRDA